MKYNKNVYILGAGFSRHAGAPLMADFLTKIKQLWDNPKSEIDETERKYFKNLLNYRANLSSVRSKINIDLHNIEELLGLAEMDVDWGTIDKSLKHDYIYTLLRTLEIYTNNYELKNEIFLNNVGIDAHSPLARQIATDEKLRGPLELKTSIYHLFAALVKNSDISANYHLDSIITFNYDLLLDKALLDTGLIPDYGVTRYITEDPKDTNIFNYLIAGTSYRHNPYIHYIKLHGSANWLFCKECNRLHLLPPHIDILSKLNIISSCQFDSYIKNRINLQCSNCHKKGALQPLIIPPTWNKFQYQKSISLAWAKALEELREAQRIIMIGYSLPSTDTFFRYLLTLGCHTSSEPELIVINPNEKGEKIKYEDFIDTYYKTVSFKFYQTYFDDKIFKIKPGSITNWLPNMIFRDFPDKK